MKTFLTTLRVTTPPASEPIDLATAKLYCRVYSDYEDTIIGSLITTARIMAEQYLARSLVTQTLLWTVKLIEHERNPYGYASIGMNQFGWGYGQWHDTLELPRDPVQAVNSVIVRDHNATDVTLDPTTYAVDLALEPARLCIYWNKVAGMATPPVLPVQHIQISLTTGYTTLPTIPTPITQAILLMVNYLYERRGDEIAMPEMPKAIFYLLDQYRIEVFGGTP